MNGWPKSDGGGELTRDNQAILDKLDDEEAFFKYFNKRTCFRNAQLLHALVERFLHKPRRVNAIANLILKVYRNEYLIDTILLLISTEENANLYLNKFYTLDNLEQFLPFFNLLTIVLKFLHKLL